MYKEDLANKVDKLLEEHENVKNNGKVEKEQEMESADEWIKSQNFETTADIKVP